MFFNNLELFQSLGSSWFDCIVMQFGYIMTSELKETLEFCNAYSHTHIKVAKKFEFFDHVA